jgi:TRAP-type C4-dicarboxylate transport system permease small subunit
VTWGIVDRLTALFFRLLEVVLVGLLLGMVVMVFGNVVLRYGFNSGLTVSEELSRYFFVWLTFIGAVVTFRENSHLGVETFVRLLPRSGRIVCMVLTQLLILACAAAFFQGTWLQSGINATMRAPVTGLPMSYVYGVGFFTAAGIFVIAALRLLRILTGRITEHDIAEFAGEAQDPMKLAERGE